MKLILALLSAIQCHPPASSSRPPVFLEDRFDVSPAFQIRTVPGTQRLLSTPKLAVPALVDLVSVSCSVIRHPILFLMALPTLSDKAAGETKAQGSDDWPSWRGPGGQGVGERHANPPERWSATEGIAWTTELKGWGNSSPIISGDRLYITSQGDDDSLLVYSLDRDGGAIVWERNAGKGRLKTHVLHNMATPTPVSDGEHVWALFGTGDLICLSRTGETLWSRNLATDHGEYKILWGMGSSPRLYGGLLYTICLHSGPSYVLAIDKLTGKDVWKVDRKVPCRDEASDSYSSPVILESAGRVELLVSGCDHISAYDPLFGKELWTSAGLKIEHKYGRTMASPGVGEGIVVACSASMQGLGKAIAVRAGGTGDVTESRRLWQYEKFTPDCPTPLVYQGHAYLVRDDGIATCLDAKTGEVRWHKRIGRGTFKASPVAAAGRVYFAAESGDCIVAKAGPDDVVIAENHLDSSFTATPALVGNRIYLRSRSKVIAVGKR